MNFLDFVNKRAQMINESISGKDLDKYMDQVEKLLKKHIDNLIPLVGYVNTRNGKNEFLSKQFIVASDKEGQAVPLFQINWLKSSDKLDPYSIDFFDNMDLAFTGSAKSKLTIHTLNSSLVYFLPIIWTVVNTKNYNLSEKEAIEIGRTVFAKSDNIKESMFYVGALRYRIFEDNIDDYRKAKGREVLTAYANKNDSKEAMARYERLDREYKEIEKAILGGATSIKEIELAISKANTIYLQNSEIEKKLQAELDSKIEDPEIVFKKMEGYLNMVVKGVNPSLIICGAPGVGKTFKVKKFLKSHGYKDPDNMFIIKGKCTPRALYTALYNYRAKNNILLIDDADGLVGPKAPEESINILKGALDSTKDEQGRLISYSIAGKITDDDGNEIPKRFYYNGGVIVITNYQAGSLDTALKGRSYVQDIHFNTDQCLKIIKNLLPDLDNETLSMTSKTKAYDFLEKLAKTTNFEISIRTFIICATIFESMDDDELAKQMIKEQMKLQTIRRKEKY